MSSLHVWLCVALVCLSLCYCEPPELQVVACFNSTFDSAALARRCVHYYRSSVNWSWIDAYGHCRIQGFELAAPNNLRHGPANEQQLKDAVSIIAEIFNVTWICSHFVFTRPEGSFLKDLESKNGSHHWFVNVFLVWYSESGAAVPNMMLHNALPNDSYDVQSSLLFGIRSFSWSKLVITASLYCVPFAFCSVSISAFLGSYDC